MARAGESVRAIASDLAVAFDDLPGSQLGEIARLEFQSNQIMDSLGALPFGRFNRLTDTAGCPQGSTGFKIGMVIKWTDQQTGLPMRFEHTATIQGANSVANLMTEAVRQVAGAAGAMGYTPSMPERMTERLMNRVEVGYIDCF